MKILLLIMALITSAGCHRSASQDDSAIVGAPVSPLDDDSYYSPDGLQVAPSNFVLSTQSEGSFTRYAVVRSINGKEFKILEVNSPSPETHVSVVPFGRMGYRLELKPLQASTALNGKSLRIKTDISSEEIRIPVRVTTNEIREPTMSSTVRGEGVTPVARAKGLQNER